MSDKTQGRELVKQLASLIDQIKRGQKQMAKASRVAAKQAEAQRDLADRVGAIEATLAKIAAKLGVGTDDEEVIPNSTEPNEETENDGVGESSNPAETAQAAGYRPFNEYTVAELREIAAGEGVEITGSMYKGDIIAALEAKFAESAG